MIGANLPRGSSLTSFYQVVGSCQPGQVSLVGCQTVRAELNLVSQKKHTSIGSNMNHPSLTPPLQPLGYFQNIWGCVEINVSIRPAECVSAASWSVLQCTAVNSSACACACACACAFASKPAVRGQLTAHSCLSSLLLQCDPLLCSQCVTACCNVASASPCRETLSLLAAFKFIIQRLLLEPSLSPSRAPSSTQSHGLATVNTGNYANTSSNAFQRPSDWRR